jgi:hypothetical protein
MKNYKAEKTTRIMRTLETIQKTNPENTTLIQVIGTIVDKVEFYDHALAGWDNPHEKCNTPEVINIGQKCCNAGLDMADAIVNDLRIAFNEGNQFS